MFIYRFEDEILNNNKRFYVYRPRFEDEIINTNWMVKDVLYIGNYV